LIVLVGVVSLAITQPAKLLTPSANAQSVPVAINPNHPRLWITPSRIANMKKEMTANSKMWQFVKAQADGDLNGGITNMVAEVVVSNVLNDSRYCTDAIPTLTNWANTYNITFDSYYATRDVWQGALVYDGCYPQLSSTDKSAIAKRFLDMATQVWPDTNPARTGGWGTANPQNNYFQGFLMTFPLAIAALGDDPRAQNMVDLGISKYQLLRGYLSGRGVGGWFHESTSYNQGSMFHLGLFLDGYDTATSTPAKPNGLDLVNDTSFMRDSLYFSIHHTLPGLTNFIDVGDAARVSDDPVSPYNLQQVAIPIVAVNDPVAASYGKFYYDSIAPANVGRWEWVDPIVFVFSNSNVAPSDYTKSQPTHYFAQGSGLLIDRSDWTNSATYTEIWASVLNESHQGHELNGFQIWKNGPLVGNASKWSQSGILAQTDAHNTLTFGPKGVQTWTPNSGNVLVHDSGTDYDVFMGQAAGAYQQDCSHTCIKTVNDFVRKYTYIKPIDSFVVYDRADIVDPTLPKEFNLHSKNQAAINGRSYSFDNGKTQMCGQSLLPANGTNLTNIAQKYGPNNNISSYRLVVSSSNNQNKDYLLNVLQLGAIGSCNLNTRTISSTAGMDGVEVLSAQGNWAVLNGKSDAITTSVSYSVSAATHQIVTDLQPDTNYQVVLNGTRTITVATDSSGIARFDVNSGETDITMNPGGRSVPPPVVGQANIQVVKTVDKTVAQDGDQLLYTITVSNTGTADASQVVVTDPLPSGLTFISASNQGSYDQITRVVNFALGTVAKGASTSITITVSIGQAAAPPPPQPPPAPGTARFTKPAGGATVNRSNTFANGLAFLAPFTEGNGTGIKDLISGQTAQTNAAWKTESTEFSGPAVDFTGSNGAGINATDQIFKVQPTTGYTFAYLFKPTTTANTGPNHIGDTNTIASFAAYTNVLAAGNINVGFRDANANVTQIKFPYAASGNPDWIQLVVTVASNTCTVYANYHQGVKINGMEVQGSTNCSLAKTWSYNNIALPSQFYLSGTNGQIVPPDEVAEMAIWNNRVFSPAEVTSFYQDPFAMLR
jgi:uncharacterized repeat protein (TIGR01451 family)